MAQPDRIEVLEAPSHPSTAAGVLARLAQREEERAAAAAARLEQLAVAADPRESVDAFLADFAARRQQLEDALQRVAGPAAAEAGGQGDAAALAEVAAQLAELEQAVADAAYFLPAYDLRQAALALSSLRERQEAAAAALQPRRRFAFSRKASAGAPASGSAPAAAGPGDAAQLAAQQQQEQQQQRQQEDEEEEGARASSAAAVASNAPLPPALQQPSQQQAAASETRSASAATSASASSPAGGAGITAITGLRGVVVAPARAEAAGQEFTLSDLEDCAVFLLAPLAALFLHRLRRCRVFTGPVAGACFVEGAEDCTLMIAARQVRIHAAHRSDFYLRVRSHPIIEHSSALRFAPYQPAYPSAAADLAEQGLGEEGGMWRRVNDFGWLRATSSPHWSVLPEAQRAAAPAGPGHLAASEAASTPAGGAAAAETAEASETAAA